MTDYNELVKELRDDNACLSLKTLHEAADAIEELQGQIDGWIEQERKVMLKSMPRWISVKERLPENDDRMLTVGKRGGIQICRYSKGTKMWWTKGNASVATVTHWMPLPKPPKEDEA